MRAIDAQSPHGGAPVVNIVGKSDSGKTGVMVGVIAALTARGWRVGTVKHHHQGELDMPGKDSWRHARAGAVATALVGQAQYAVFKKVDSEPPLEDIVEALGETDIVLVEGFKGTANARIEVARRGRSDELATDPATLFAVVTDDPELAPDGIPVFGLDEPERLAEVIERHFLRVR